MLKDGLRATTQRCATSLCTPACLLMACCAADTGGGERPRSKDLLSAYRRAPSGETAGPVLEALRNGRFGR